MPDRAELRSVPATNTVNVIQIWPSGYNLGKASERCWPKGSWMRKMRHSGVGLVAAVLASAVFLLTVSPASAASSRSVPPKAKKALLVRADLPKGWVAVKSGTGGPTIPGVAQLASCLHVPSGVIASNPPSASSPAFRSPNKLLIVNDSVAVYRSAKAARADFSAAGNSKTPGCLTALLNGPAKTALAGGLGSGATIGAVQVVKAPASEFAPHGAGFIAYLPVTEAGQTLNVALTLIEYVKGTETQTVTLISLENPFPKTLAHHLTTLAAKRL